MSKRLRSGILAMVVAIFAFALVVAPKTALAAETFWSYTDQDTQASVSLEDEEWSVGDRDLTVTVIVDGVEKKSETITDTHTSLTVLRVNAPEGYDVYVEQDGTHLTGNAGNDRFDVAPTANELTVSLAKSVKANNFTIADDTTEYGTFSWANSYATNSAFPRHLTVKVDGKVVAETTVTTPSLLTNETDTPRYWFTPNASKFKTSDVTITPPNSLNNSTHRNITVDLVSLCGCGRDTCLCEGGCECPVDCPCPDCTGATLGEHQINTGYGILSYEPSGSEDEGTGYNLTVKIYVNGMIAWDGLSERPLRIKGAVDGDGNYLNNLGFEEASGYYYFAYENSYDLDTYGNAASTWDKNQSRLEFADPSEESRNYHNVLNIYLWTFANSVDLNVDRAAAVGDEVWNYTISYDLPDPKTGEMRTWTYNATSFDVTQTQIIPKNVPVTLTGVCEPGKEVELWHCEDARETSLRGITFTDPNGNNSEWGTEVEGPSAVLTVNSPETTDVLVTIKAFNWAKAPTPEEIKDILDESAVTVDCVSPYVSHESETYALADNTFTVGNPYGDGDGYYVDVTVNPDSYLGSYNDGKSEHTLADPDQDKVITFSHDGTKWVAKDGESPLVLEVMCNDAPADPTYEQIKELIGDIKVDCVNDEAYHVTGSYALQDGYTTGQVFGDAENGFTVTVSVPAGAYVDQYDAETNVEHELADASTSPAVVTFENTGNGWTVKFGTPVVFKVVCETLPDVPTFDQFKDIFAGGLVTVDCINGEVDPAHEDKTYDVLEGSYLFGDVTSNDDGTFSVDMDVYPARYAQQYSIDTQINHWLDPANQNPKQVTLTYANDVWTADDSAAIKVTVKCANETEIPPLPPTHDKLKNLEGADITVACVTDDSHEEKPYDPILGAYTFGAVTKNAEGVYEVVMTVTPSEYVNSYVADTEENHWLADREDVAKTLKLQYKGDAWVVVSEGISYKVVCLPDPPSKDEVKAILGNAAVTVDCVSPYVSHESADYPLADDTFKVDDSYATGEGYFVDVTVAPDTYVDAYGPDSSFHKLANPDTQDKVIRFRYVNGEWEPCYGESPLVIEVICSDAPEAPTDELIKNLIGDVKVDCINTQVNHMTGAYELSDYTPGSFLASSEGGFTYTVTISAESYVDQYNAAQPGHKLVDGATNPATVTLENKGEGWKVQSGTPVVFEVICENQTPTPGGGDGDDERPTPDDTGVSDWLDTEDHRAYLSGYGDGSGLFGVDEPMTRAEAATMFHNLLLDKSMGDHDADFPDLREGAYYVDAVRTLASRGIIMGNGDGTFAPDRPITRAEFVAIAMRFTDSDQSGANPFSDVEEGSWYYGPVVGSAKFGWVSGYVDGTFAPEDTLTRGQATAIVNHMLGRAADEAWVEDHIDRVKTFPDVYEGHFAYGEVLEATNSHDYEWEDGVESWTGLRK